ncbi:vicilin-like seed storage protein At2g18540 [Macadamia integrifolia]|uniref:vicilin-like seed storage protein At2g18540 n=1 Tax=Macadamia integrifolia TaxID=60698 RepID=UPI001C4F076A|nr:vicilin-like seed storage protein At2g18540 [Macadamia integrifolia]
MAKRRNLSSKFLFSIVIAIIFSWYVPDAAAIRGSKDVVSGSGAATLVTKEDRKTLVRTDSGVITSVEIGDGTRKPHQLQSITLDPNSLLLPVLLHSDMVFYVHTGSGSMSWVGEDGRYETLVKRGDIYWIPEGSLFFARSSLESTRERLRIYAIFTDTNDQNPYEPYIGPYSMLSDLVLGFDDKTLQLAFRVPQEVIEEISSGTKPPAIVHATFRNETEESEEDRGDWRAGIIEALIGPEPQELDNDKKMPKQAKTFNIFTEKPDYENCNGWSLEVNPKKTKALKGSNVGVYMVNLTKGSMMAPHWNPRATEIAIVTHGQGMIHVVCPSNANETECKNTRFRVSEGDVFVVSRFHPMAQISFNNDTFVFMGFSTMAAKNYPQFLAGKSSVLRTLDREILATAFNVPNTTIDQLLASQVDSVILECTSCAEEEEAAMEEEIEKERQQEEEEEARRREEEEEERKRREEEEEEARSREEEEEEARRREEEARRQEEEAEEARREEEEKEARRSEEEARRQEEEEEEARTEKEDLEARREEEARRQEEEEAMREEEERQQERAHRRQEAKEAARRREEEEAGRRPERRKRWSEEEEARRQEEERQRRTREEWEGDGEGEGEGEDEDGEEVRRLLKSKWRF